MAKYVVGKERLTAIADKIRSLLGLTGTMKLDEMANNLGTVNAEVDTQAELINQISTALEGKAGGGIDTSDATAEASDILQGETAYVNGNKVIGTMPTQTLPTPTIEVLTGGLITATDTLSASGYVASGTKSATKQLTTQAAKTVTPSASSQTAVESGRYTTGAVTVAGDSNLVAGNIKNGVSIFGVAGNYEGSGGGGSVETCTVILDRTGAIGTNRLLYTNGNMAVTEGTLTQSGKVNFSETFEVAKGTLLYTFFVDSGGTIIEGEAEIISTNLYAIYGDATISS